MRLTLLSRWIERSTIKETTTKIVSTVATDQVGVKANDRISLVFSAILPVLVHPQNLLLQILSTQNFSQANRQKETKPMKSAITSPTHTQPKIWCFFPLSHFNCNIHRRQIWKMGTSHSSDYKSTERKLTNVENEGYI